MLGTYGTDGVGRFHAPPAANATLFGRDEALAALLDALRARGVALVYGLGGMGKTALAARAMVALHAEGIFTELVWVNEVGGASLAAVCDAVTRLVGDDPIPRLPPAAKPAALRAWLAGRAALLVLDDVAGREVVEQFMAECRTDGVALLLTSRDHLLVADEEFPLREPDHDKAIELFQNRARHEGDAALVGEICARLGNHPLALVIAAGRVRAEGMTLARLLKRLDDVAGRLPTLRLGQGGAKDRDVRLSLQLSYDALRPAEQRVFTHLAACFGDSTGLELLADACGMAQDECEDHLGRLVRLSLVMREGDRFLLHPLVRDLGRALLGDTLPTVQDTLLEAACAYAQRYEQETAEAYDQLESELSNLLGAVRYAAEREAWQDVVELADSLFSTSHFLDVRGYWGEWVSVGRMGITASEALSDDTARGRNIHNTAYTLQNQGNYDVARELYQQSLDIFRKLGNQKEIATSLHQLGMIAHDQGSVEEASDLYQQSLDLSRELDHRVGMVMSLHQLGIMAQQGGKLDEARELYQQSLDIRRKLGDHAGIATSLHQLGTIAQEQGELVEARGLYQQSLDINRELGAQSGIASGLHQLGNLAYLQSELVEARRLYQQSLDINRKLGNQQGIAGSLYNLGLMAEEQDDLDEAHQLITQALAIFEQLKSPHTGNAQWKLAWLAAKRSREAESVEWLWSGVEGQGEGRSEGGAGVRSAW